MNTKHTPGPWRASGLEYPSTANGIILYCSEGVNIGTIGTSPYSGKAASAAQYAETAKANAHLIAAAPELLEALEAVLRFDNNMPGEYKHDVTLAIKVRKAIAKATGETI